MREQDTHTMEQHIKDRLADYEKAWIERGAEILALKARTKRLEEWIRNEGQRANTCTFEILGREICAGCECGRRK